MKTMSDAMPQLVKDHVLRDYFLDNIDYKFDIYHENEGWTIHARLLGKESLQYIPDSALTMSVDASADAVGEVMRRVFTDLGVPEALGLPAS